MNTEERHIYEEWTAEVPNEPGLYWVLQAGYKQELANAGHPPLVQLIFYPRDGDRKEFWRVRLLAGSFFHLHGAMFGIWAKEPRLEWMLDNYDIQGWKRVELPIVPEGK